MASQGPLGILADFSVVAFSPIFDQLRLGSGILSYGEPTAEPTHAYAKNASETIGFSQPVFG